MAPAGRPERRRVTRVFFNASAQLLKSRQITTDNLCQEGIAHTAAVPRAMKQTPSAIVCLAAAILATGSVVAYSTGHFQASALLALLSAVFGIVGTLSLIQACMRDHDLAVDVTGRLDFLQELVYLERLSLEHKDRLRSTKGGSYEPGIYSIESSRKKAA